MNKTIEVDIAVIGGGVTGLFITKKLTDLGFKVALIEKEKLVGSGPSTRNQGWLHKGAYHTGMISSRQEALAVGKRCVYGYEQILNFAPEAIEERESKTVALIKDDSLTSEVISRWKEGNINHKKISVKQLSRLVPQVNMTNISQAFEVGDVSLNTRILYSKLLHLSKRGGAKIFTSAKYIPINRDTGEIHLKNIETFRLKATYTVIAVGSATKELYKKLTGKDLMMHFWKSHLIVLPRLVEHNLFYLDSKEATLINHGDVSIVSQQQDGILVNTPNQEVKLNLTDNVIDALIRLLPGAREYINKFHIIACIKPEIRTSQSGETYSVNLNIFEPIENYIFALPGKMTEAPFVSDLVIQRILRGSKVKNKISLRPCDFLMVKAN